MKQTAIEWFAEKDTELTIQFLEGKLNQIQLAIEKTKCLQQAKEMEKKQIVDAFKEGLSSPYHQNYTLVTQEGQEQTKSGQYYNETYGQ